MLGFNIVFARQIQPLMSAFPNILLLLVSDHITGEPIYFNIVTSSGTVKSGHYPTTPLSIISIISYLSFSSYGSS